MQISKKYTICIFSALYLPSMGGVENYTYNLSKALTELGHKVIVITNNSHNKPPIERTDEGIEVHRLPCISLIDSRLPLPRFGQSYKKSKSQIYDINPDFVVINTRFYPLCITATRFANKKGITPVVIEHGSAYLTLGNFIFDSLVKIYEHSVTAILKKYNPSFYGVSSSASKWLQNYKIMSDGTLHNSIDANNYYDSASERNFRKELEINKDVFIVSFVGRLVPEKGITALIDAAAKLRHLDKSIYFLIAGNGPLSDSLERTAPRNVIFLGKLTSSDIASLLKTSDVFCLPSRSEGFSTSLLEAAACYTAPIITNVGGAEELIPEDKYGIIIESATANEISNAILYLKENPEEKLLMSRSVGTRVRKLFSWNTTARNTIAACINANSQT